MASAEIHLPPNLMERMKLYWAKVTRAFADMESQEPVSQHEFAKMVRYIGSDISDAELERAMKPFDKYNDGRVDHTEFLKVVSQRLFPANSGGGLSLNLNPSNFKIERPRGRAKYFKDLHADWNNWYHQSTDPSNEGKPMLQSVMQGKFYMEKPRPQSSRAATHRLTKGVILDETLQQPMVKSLMEGEFYFVKSPGRQSARSKTDFIARNCRMQKEYCRMGTTRPVSASFALSLSRSLDKSSPLYSAFSPTSPYKAHSARFSSSPRLADPMHGKGETPRAVRPASGGKGGASGGKGETSKGVRPDNEG
eukprot:CAMPEP_0181334942 /NCGR_PEP_ID=MMETSP1101-20121128/26555_1 /TAXON_ID=46948 /ORGANISM="Rhodomonas abbreviata, Strain Caron Lab Isolate" /LENGTH=307 /DNA_ID=CAMNT_0023445005 /DNA_START=138 /DNA_END=1058 /DNA_ORIENTATION=+